MSDTVLERCRKLHSEAEHLKKLAAKTLMKDPKGFRDRLYQDEVVCARIEKVTENSRKLLEVYKDEQDVLKDCLKEMAGQHAFKAFYSKVSGLKKNKPDRKSDEIPADMDDCDVEVVKQWSGSEWRGRFLDLHAHYQEYTNLKKTRQVSYKKYLQCFHHFHRIPIKNEEYKAYLTSLLAYLQDFWNRINPLYPHSRVMELCTKEFQEKWDKKKFPGYQVPWELKVLQAIEAASVASTQGPHLPDDMPDPKLFCLETQKWFNNEGSLNSHKRGKKWKKAKEKGVDRFRDVALMEALISLFAGLLEDTIDRTVEFMEKRQTKTYDEIKREIEEAEEQSDSSDDEAGGEDQFGAIYNPLKIPLDFDGKPIPYWLYKFRGLNRYFNCQICGNRDFRGPMSFERHFSEWRHAHGMRTLGIPNTKDFMWITSINDAISLWGKIKDRKKDAVWNPADEEVEDFKGNVYNRPTFENLQFQNLIQV